MSTEKKRLIRIEAPANTSPYTSKVNTMMFSFVSSPENGRRQICNPHTCRESINRIPWAYVSKSISSWYDPKVAPPLDMNKLRLLIILDPSNLKVFKQKLFSGKAALNLYEELAGWEKSKITTVSHPNYSNAWLLTGPKEWVSQPQLLSFATWVIRLASKHGPMDVNNYDALENFLYNKQRNTMGDSDVTTYCPHFWDKGYILVKYADRIFDGIDIDSAWNPENQDAFGIISGFMSFCTASLDYSDEVRTAQKVFKHLCKKHLPRKTS